MRSQILYALGTALLLSACTRGLSPEEQAKVSALSTELESTKKEIASAGAQKAQYGAGLIKTLIDFRLEVLKTNEALIQQRIHAIESGAKVSTTTLATDINSERAKLLEDALAQQESKASQAEAQANINSTGLIGAMAGMSAMTERNTVAMLRQQHLVAKYGLAPLQIAAPASGNGASVPATNEHVAAPMKSQSAHKDLRDQVLAVTLLRKQFTTENYQDFISMDVAFDPSGLDKPARAIKGALLLTDLFDEQKFAVRWTIDNPIAPGAVHTEKGTGFKYNQFTDAHQWVRNTDKENIKIKFRVESILYQDGTSRDFE